MGNFPFGYEPIEATTWAYLSSLLMLALFFKFNRFWSVRNFDLLLIILLAPGLLMVHYGEKEQNLIEASARKGAAVVLETETDSEVGQIPKSNGPEDRAAKQQNFPSNSNGTPVTSADPKIQPNQSKSTGETASENPADASDDQAADANPAANALTPFQKRQRLGYIWLFVIGAIWIVRLFYDPLLVRKPMLEPNLTVGGLVFLTCSLTIFLFANVWNSEPTNVVGPVGAENLVKRNAEQAGDQLRKYGPGYPLLFVIPSIRTFELDDDTDLSAAETVERHSEFDDVARFMAILCQIAIIGGLIFIGKNHFGSFQMGVGMAAIFLMLPYTAQYGGDSLHLLPGALLIWAIAGYRKPEVAGCLIGIAASVCYYPLFLLPLWISFYWERGRKRFILGALLAIALVISSLSLTSADFAGFVAQLKSIFGFILPRQEGLGGIWALNWESWFRLPLLVGFIALCISYAVWPSVKDLACLISSTATAMVAVQFWHGDGGGLYMAWYLPLILLVIFRPNLDDKIAISVLEEPRIGRKPAKSGDLDFAA